MPNNNVPNGAGEGSSPETCDEAGHERWAASIWLRIPSPLAGPRHKSMLRRVSDVDNAPSSGGDRPCPGIEKRMDLGG